MGKYLNEVAKKRGHNVTWVQCPQDAGTARELQAKLKRLLPKHDAFLMAAAVADVRPEDFSKYKIKKNRLKSIRLVKNPDILATLSKKKKKNQVFIGFALESQGMFDNGLKKLVEKKLEAIVLQKVTENEKPFGDKKIDAFVLENKGNFAGFKAISKKDLAKFLIQKTERFLVSKRRD
jgi:phosphopantothenoylcysteine decarboxylase/phosphopantothenate--cysteine ligase